MRRPTLLLLATLVAPVTALAAPCSGFDDVDSTSVFCPSVDWIKNRGVTLGCTASSLYCPTQAVNRLSMAAFMNRLGVALTPVVVHAEASGGVLDFEAAPPTLCSTGQIPPAAYPRSGHASAIVGAQFDAPATLAMRVVYSTDNGTTWTPANATPASAGGEERWVNATIATGDIAIAPGQPIRFGVRVQRDATGAGNADVVAWNCEIKTIVNTRTGTSAPF